MTLSTLHLSLAQLVRLAVRESGQSTAEVARKAGLKWDTVRRTVNGSRPATMPEFVAILEGAGYQPEETLRLMMLVDADFAVSRANTEVARFLVELLKCVPCEIVTQLGDDAEDLRPRWANGTAKMLARTLAQHVTDLNRRGDAIGDRLGQDRL